MTNDNDADDDPIARPTKDRGDLFVLSDEDIAEISAELYSRIREWDGVDDTLAQEISTAVHETFTDDWSDYLND